MADGPIAAPASGSISPPMTITLRFFRSRRAAAIEIEFVTTVRGRSNGISRASARFVLPLSRTLWRPQKATTAQPTIMLASGEHRLGVYAQVGLLLAKEGLRRHRLACIFLQPLTPVDLAGTASLIPEIPPQERWHSLAAPVLTCFQSHLYGFSAKGTWHEQ